MSKLVQEFVSFLIFAYSLESNALLTNIMTININIKIIFDNLNQTSVKQEGGPDGSAPQEAVFSFGPTGWQ